MRDLTRGIGIGVFPGGRLHRQPEGPDVDEAEVKGEKDRGPAQGNQNQRQLLPGDRDRVEDDGLQRIGNRSEIGVDGLVNPGGRRRAEGAKEEQKKDRNPPQE